MSTPEAEELTFDWAHKRWEDPLTGTEVVCLSPPRAAHFRVNYFRFNMFTSDGKFVVFHGADELDRGLDRVNRRLWARELATGELIDLGELPDIPDSLRETITNFHGSSGQWSVSPHDHTVNVIDCSNDQAWALIQIDIDTGRRSRVEPAQPLGKANPFVSADGKHTFIEWRRDIEHLARTTGMGRLGEQPVGYQEMQRIDLRTGRAEKLFDNQDLEVAWNMDHVNPNPVDANLFMCQSGSTDKRQDSIRIRDLAAGQWLDIHRRPPQMLRLVHEHWNRSGRRVYSHTWISMAVHCVNRIDLDTNENVWLPCQPDEGFSQHILISPDETFMVGDGYEFDRNSLPTDVRARMERHIADGDREPRWFSFYLTPDLTNGGETIFKYELPQQSILEDDRYWENYEQYMQDPEPLNKILRANREGTVTSTPICKFRTLLRSPKLMGYRNESNAHVSPDSRWTVFQSSSDDDFFEVWAARVPDTPYAQRESE